MMHMAPESIDNDAHGPQSIDNDVHGTGKHW